MLITLTEYAELHGKNPATVRQLAGRGSLRTAVKVGRDWMVDDAEPYPDNRTTEARKLKAKDVFTSEAYEALTAEERRSTLKWEQAKEYSGWRQYPTTCAKIFARFPSDALDRYTAAQLGEIARLMKQAYDDGVAFGRGHKEE